jgi:hypothetical protein
VLVAVGERHLASVEAVERELKLAAARVAAVLADHDAVVRCAKAAVSTPAARDPGGNLRAIAFFAGKALPGARS